MILIYLPPILQWLCQFLPGGELEKDRYIIVEKYVSTRRIL